MEEPLWDGPVLSRGQCNRMAGRGFWGVGEGPVTAGLNVGSNLYHQSVGELLSLKQGRDMSRYAF